MGENKVTAFGPVPSRRLGQSMGINNIPPKICTYSCIYCQLGRTIKVQTEREVFYELSDVIKNVQDKVRAIRSAGETIDYLSFVPDGEPTLDLNLGKEIEQLKKPGIPIAVITNASLIGDYQVREALMKADWVSLKVDSVDETVWRRVNRPHKKLKLTTILEGALEFASAFQGKLTSETMLVTGVNDGSEHIGEVAKFLSHLHPAAAYLAIPTRPPAVKWAQPPDEIIINRAYQIFTEKLDHVEYLVGFEGNTFSYTGDVKEDLLNITAVHPMREDSVEVFLERAHADWKEVKQLINNDQLIRTEYAGHGFYLRRFKRSHTH